MRGPISYLRGWGRPPGAAPILRRMTPDLHSGAPPAALCANARLRSAPGFELRRAASREDWARVGALRYAALRAHGEIADDSKRAFDDGLDTLPGSATFVLARNHRDVGSTRSSVRSARRPAALPSTRAFGAEIQAALGADATIVEASLTVTDPAACVDPTVALFHLFKAHMLHCAAENADWLIVAVREAQMGFYRRMFNMEILTGVQAVPGLATARIVMGLEYRAQAALIFKRIPLLAVEAAEELRFAKAGAISFGAGSG